MTAPAIGSRYRRRVERFDGWDEVELVAQYDQPEIAEYVVRRPDDVAGGVSVTAADLAKAFSLISEPPPSVKGQLGVDSAGEWVS